MNQIEINPLGMNRAMMRAGLGVRDLARKARMSHEECADILTGRTRPMLLELEKLARVLGCAVTDIAIPVDGD